MSKRNRKSKGCGWFDANYWQSADFNQRTYQMHLEWISAIALNRFKWIGLPDSCNERFLEQCLLRNGYASIAPDESGVWYTFLATYSSDFTPYGEPAKWLAESYGTGRSYEANWSTGALCWDNRSFTNPWNTIQLLARKLTHILRTEDINLSHQQTPWIFTAPENKKLELANLVKQVNGGEPVIMANSNFADNFTYDAISTQVPFIGLELNVQYENVWRQVYKFLGLDSLAVEKKERVIEEEVKATSQPAVMRRLDGLEARRDAARHINSLQNDFEVQVVFNDDYDSYNYAFENSLQMQAEQLGSVDDNEL